MVKPFFQAHQIRQEQHHLLWFATSPILFSLANFAAKINQLILSTEYSLESPGRRVCVMESGYEEQVPDACCCDIKGSLTTLHLIISYHPELNWKDWLYSMLDYSVIF